jgi:hypothetical protein
VVLMEADSRALFGTARPAARLAAVWAEADAAVAAVGAEADTAVAAVGGYLAVAAKSNRFVVGLLSDSAAMSPVTSPSGA